MIFIRYSGYFEFFNSNSSVSFTSIIKKLYLVSGKLNLVVLYIHHVYIIITLFISYPILFYNISLFNQILQHYNFRRTLSIKLYYFYNLSHSMNYFILTKNQEILMLIILISLTLVLLAVLSFKIITIYNKYKIQQLTQKQILNTKHKLDLLYLQTEFKKSPIKTIRCSPYESEGRKSIIAKQQQVRQPVQNDELIRNVFKLETEDRVLRKRMVNNIVKNKR